jgi:hypothetical protein
VLALFAGNIYPEMLEIELTRVEFCQVCKVICDAALMSLLECLTIDRFIIRQKKARKRQEEGKKKARDGG